MKFLQMMNELCNVTENESVRKIILYNMYSYQGSTSNETKEEGNVTYDIFICKKIHMRSGFLF